MMNSMNILNCIKGNIKVYTVSKNKSHKIPKIIHSRKIQTITKSKASTSNISKQYTLIYSKGKQKLNMKKCKLN